MTIRSAASPAGDPVRHERLPDADPVVVVGMACRAPGGVRSPEELFDLVTSSSDALSEFPTDRGWDLRALTGDGPGHSDAHRGGFLDRAGAFDAGFFGISPREALAMDPQQRLLLETTWEACERAGIDPSSLHGTDTGVFVGLHGQDYAVAAHGSPDDLSGHAVTGMSGAVASGRIAYVLGCEGPALTLDTASSSSLVALHYAARALRFGECGLALAGGATVMSTPAGFVGYSRQGGLSRRGRPAPFSDAADGTVWGEGAGMVVLARLSTARRRGHPVLAVLRGSAVNQDGASDGLTAPSGDAQQRVIRAALHDAALAPSDVDVVEGHGTGTRVGDPVELAALAATYGDGRDEPLLLGSAKSHIGHLQAAAGVVSVIKTVLSVRRGVVPGLLHLTDDHATGGVRPVARTTDWPATGRPRRAGVSSFGISGTNAHLIVEQAPEPADSVAPATHAGPVPWIVSARDADALDDAVRALGTVTADPLDVGHTLAHGRARFAHRAVLLSGPGRGTGPAEVARGEAADARLAILFSGQGGQRDGMGSGLHATFPVFAAAFDQVADELDPRLPRGLREVIDAGDGALQRTGFAQPALFALQVALYRLVESWGIAAQRLAGHSVGEIAAAHVSGMLPLADACALVAARARLMEALPGGGAMLAVEATEDEVAPHLTAGVSIAAVNGPTAVVVSGVDEEVDAVAARFADRRTRRLSVSHAFHSPLMDPMLDEFAAVVDTLRFSEPLIPVVSTVTGRPAGPGEMTGPGYWVRQVRRPVRFADAVRALGEQGTTTMLELGPDATLTAAAHAVAPEGTTLVPALRRDRDEATGVLTAAARLHVTGTPVDWSPLLTGGRPADLPTYPFRHRDYWPAAAPSVTPGGHPVLGAGGVLADGDGALFTGRVSRDTQPWLHGYAHGGNPVLPTSALMESVLRAADEVGCDRVEELVTGPLAPMPEHATVVVQTRVGPADGDGRRAVTVHTRTDGDGGWTRRAHGTLARGARPATIDTDAWPPSGAVAVTREALGDGLRRAGIGGPPADDVRTVWRRDGETFVEVAVPDGTDVSGFGLHPALLAAVLGAVEHPGLPWVWRDVALHATGASGLGVRIARGSEPDAVTITAVDPAGGPVLTVGSVRLRPLPDALSDVPDAATPAPSGVRPVRPVAAAPTAPAAPGPGDAARWARLAGPARRRALLELVRTTAADVLGLPGRDAVGSRDRFKDLGLESLTGLELSARLSAQTGLSLPSTLAFDHPTPALVAEHLTESLTESLTEPGPAPGPAPEPGPRRAPADIPDDDISTASLDDLIDILDSEFDVA